MKNIDLECIPSWRYCNIPRGQKGPSAKGWQSNPLKIADIEQSGNVGLILGPYSQGTCAIDFDGTSAWRWFTETFPDLEIPKTVSWASGKPDRCQMAFRVPEPYWDLLRTIKISLDPIPNSTKFEGFEFRWSGGQSVLPPSLHPDTGEEYFWISAPSACDLADLPEEILCYWLLRANPEPEVQEKPKNYDAITNDEVVAMCEELKRCYPNMDYDMWSKTTWAVCRELGKSDGLAVMKYLWPPQSAGEYENLFKSSYNGRTVTMGSIIGWIRSKNPAYRKDKKAIHEEKYQRFVSELEELQELERLIKEKRNECVR